MINLFMRKATKKCHFWQRGMCQALYFWPLIIMGGRLVAKVILNIWNLFEPGGHTQTFQETIP